MGPFKISRKFSAKCQNSNKQIPDGTPRLLLSTDPGHTYSVSKSLSIAELAKVIVEGDVTKEILIEIINLHRDKPEYFRCNDEDGIRLVDVKEEIGITLKAYGLDEEELQDLIDEEKEKQKEKQLMAPAK